MSAQAARTVTVTGCGDCLFRLGIAGHAPENAYCALNDEGIWENTPDIKCPLIGADVLVRREPEDV